MAIRANTFSLNSEIKQVEKELRQAEQKQLRKAANYFNKKLRAKIKSLQLVDEGNLLKGVSKVTLDHAVLVGLGAPAFHALLVEYGTSERKTNNKYHNEHGITNTGSTEERGFFLKTMQENITQIQNILGEVWL